MGQMQGAFGRSWMRQQPGQSAPAQSMFSQYMQRPMFQAAMQRPAQNFMNYLPLLLSRGMFNAPQQGATPATPATPATAAAPAVPALPAVPPIQNVPSIASQAPPPTYQATPAINPAAAPAPAPAAPAFTRPSWAAPTSWGGGQSGEAWDRDVLSFAQQRTGRTVPLDEAYRLYEQHINSAGAGGGGA